mgnify:CR=1 FL=1
MPAVRGNPGKWARNAAASSQEYAQGVQNPRRSWQQAAGAAGSNYQVGVQQAISQNRYESGVQKAGDTKYKQGVQEKGVARFGQGVSTQSAQGRYQQGFAPYESAIEGVTLPPRGPKGQNLARVQAIQDAMIAQKASA